MKIFCSIIILGCLALDINIIATTKKPVVVPYTEMNPAPTNTVFLRAPLAVQYYLKQYQPPAERYHLHIFDCRQFAMALIHDAHTHGFEAHLVILSFDQGLRHAIVGFPTTGKTIFVDTTPTQENGKSLGVRLVELNASNLEWAPLRALEPDGSENLSIPAAISARRIVAMQEFPDQTLRVSRHNNTSGP